MLPQIDSYVAKRLFSDFLENRVKPEVRLTFIAKMHYIDKLYYLVRLSILTSKKILLICLLKGCLFGCIKMMYFKFEKYVLKI